MKITPPAAWSPRARSLVLLAALLGVTAALLAAKLRLLGPFVALRPGSTLGLVVLFAASVAAGARLLAVRLPAAAGLAAPSAVVLLVALVNTPMAYEMDAFAESLPHPAGGVTEDAVGARRFEAGHPTSHVGFRYPEGTDLAALTQAAVQAFESEGWEVSGVTRPGEENAGSVATFGYFVATRWGFRATCFLGDEGGPALRCAVTV